MSKRNKPGERVILSELEPGQLVWIYSKQFNVTNPARFEHGDDTGMNREIGYFCFMRPTPEKKFAIWSHDVRDGNEVITYRSNPAKATFVVPPMCVKSSVLLVGVDYIGARCEVKSESVGSAIATVAECIQEPQPWRRWEIWGNNSECNDTYMVVAHSS